MLTCVDGVGRLSHGSGQAGGLTYLITNSTRILTVNHTIHGGATEAVVEAGGEGGHSYHNLRLIRRVGQHPVRLLAANADGFHSSCVRIAPKLIDSEISFTGDDLLNIHNRMSLVLRPLSSTSAFIIDTEGSSSPGDYDESTYLFPETRAGDTIVFWALKTLAAAGTATVASAERSTDASIIAEARAAYNAITQAPYSVRIGHDFGTRVCARPQHLLPRRLRTVRAVRVARHHRRGLRVRARGAFLRRRCWGRMVGGTAACLERDDQVERGARFPRRRCCIQRAREWSKDREHDEQQLLWCGRGAGQPVYLD